MALASALAAICPPGFDDFCDHEMITLITSDGHAVRCLEGLLRARCPKGPQAAAGEELSVVLPLLQWIYAARVQERPVGDFDLEHFARIVRLAESWGLRDVAELQERLMAKRSRARGAGSLPEDLLTAYRNNELSGRFSFRCPSLSNKDTKADEEEMEVPLEGGLTALLQVRSEYFGAMLSGAWAESCPTKDEKTVVTMYWPRDQMARLLEFIHGGTFVAKVEDLRTAVDCAAFFGVPSLLHHVREWIANNLKVSTAPTLWRFVETEPLLKMQDIDGCEDAEDVEAACFEFHLEHFSELAGIKVWESFGGDDETNDASEEEPPMHTLSIELFHRLLMSGLVRLPTRQLICVVERFARAKCSDPSCTEAFAKLFTSLMPPAVIFNRDCRSALLQFNDVPARTMITI